MKIANMAYHCSLIVEGVHDRENDVARQIAAVNTTHVERQLDLMLRDIQSSPDWQDKNDLAHQLHFHFDPVRHALTFLADYLTGRAAPEADRLTAVIFAMYVYAEVPKLIRDFGYEEPLPQS
jgi:hypothetical protein